MFMFRSNTLVSLFAIGAIAACGSSSSTPDGALPPDAAHIDAASAPDANLTPDALVLPSLAGVWQFSSGSILAGESVGNVTFLSLNDDGTGAVYSRSENIGAKGAIQLIYAVVDPHVVTFGLDYSGCDRCRRHLDGLAVYDDTGEDVHDYQYALTDATTLTLTDVSGTVATFTHAASIGDSMPMAITTSASITIPTADQPWNFQLVSDDTNLWYPTAPNTIDAQPYNPATMDFGTAVAINNSQNQTGFYYLKTMSSGDFWLSCNCGSNNELQRWSSDGTTKIDDFTATNFSGINFAAADDDDLWILANDSTGSFQFLTDVSIANFATTPDTVGASYPLANDEDIEGLAMVDGDLWALMDFVNWTLVKIDPSTGLAIETYTVPNADNIDMQQLAGLGGSFYNWYVNNETGGNWQLQQLSGGF